jgi:hypothetical protein
MLRLPLATGAALLVLATALAGCVKDYGGSGGSTPTTTPTFPSYSAVPNHRGTWAHVEGNYEALRVQTRVTAYNATTGAARQDSAECTTPYSFDVDVERRRLNLTNRTPLHPYDPGPLRVVLLHELIKGPRCIFRGAFGINENTTSPAPCVSQLSAEEQARRDLWQCRLPVDPVNDPRAAVWINISVVLEDAAAGGYRVGLNGQTYGADARHEVSWRVQRPGLAFYYDVNVTIDPLGSWPYAGVRRV